MKAKSQISNSKSQTRGKSKFGKPPAEPTLRSLLADAQHWLCEARAAIHLTANYPNQHAAKLRNIAITVGLALDKLQDILVVEETAEAKERKGARP